MLYILFRYLHFAGIFVLAGALVIENLAISRTLTSEDARNLARVDAFYGLGALATFVFGLVLWLWVGKPAAFYTENPVFHAKVGLFVLIALLSIYPTVFFLRHRRSDAESVAVPPWVPRLLRLELALLIIIPVLAVLMARGVGLSGMLEEAEPAEAVDVTGERGIQLQISAYGINVVNSDP